MIRVKACFRLCVVQMEESKSHAEPCGHSLWFMDALLAQADLERPKQPTQGCLRRKTVLAQPPASPDICWSPPNPRPD